jgi:hypothetical protein
VGVLASESGSARPNLAEQRLIDTWLAADTGRPAGLAVGVDTADAQVASHLAVLGGVGRDESIRIQADRNLLLTSMLDAVAAETDSGTATLIDGLLGVSGPLVSRWGSDPVWGSEPTPRGPYIHQFPLRTAVGTDISLPGQEARAVVVGHPVNFDATRGLWYCDLQLDVGGAYQPFVDLALVRYQPYSVGGYHASSVVKPGFIQLVPDRTAAVTMLTDRTLLVSLRGPSGYNRLGQEFMFGSPVSAQVDASREVTAQVQVRPKGGSDLDWRPWGTAARLHASGSQLADIHWGGTIFVLTAGDDQDQRVVISEYELFEADASTAEVWVKRPPGGVGEAAAKPAGRRLVFATEFDL